MDFLEKIKNCQIFEGISERDIKALKEYLEHCLEQIEIWRDEFQSSKEAEAEAKQKQIIKEYLRILCPKITPPVHLD